jgi:hypothetical protein
MRHVSLAREIWPGALSGGRGGEIAWDAGPASAQPLTGWVDRTADPRPLSARMPRPRGQGNEICHAPRENGSGRRRPPGPPPDCAPFWRARCRFGRIRPSAQECPRCGRPHDLGRPGRLSAPSQCSQATRGPAGALPSASSLEARRGPVDSVESPAAASPAPAGVTPTAAPAWGLSQDPFGLARPRCGASTHPPIACLTRGRP